MASESEDLDGVVAAPEHHRVLFENDRVRVVETSIPVGDITPLRSRSSTSRARSASITPSGTSAPKVTSTR
jgi:hypothetical protein